MACELREAGKERSLCCQPPPEPGMFPDSADLSPQPSSAQDPQPHHSHFKDQQPPLEQRGHHRGNQARQDGSGVGLLSSLLLLPNIGLFLPSWSCSGALRTGRSRAAGPIRSPPCLSTQGRTFLWSQPGPRPHSPRGNQALCPGPPHPSILDAGERLLRVFWWQSRKGGGEGLTPCLCPLG